ncbi:transposase [Lentibacillus cibarius]|nr:transposase [Lentibacillus cibarius]
MMKEVKKSPDVEKIMELPISYEEKGKEKGKEKAIKEMALAMISEGASTAFIAKVTQLSEEEIDRLRQKN